MTDDYVYCIFCGKRSAMSAVHVFDSGARSYYVKCWADDCYASGPERATARAALLAWQRPAIDQLTPGWNQLFTFATFERAELGEMSGELEDILRRIRIRQVKLQAIAEQAETAIDSPIAQAIRSAGDE